MSLQFYNQNDENILNVNYDSGDEEVTIYVMQTHCPVRNRWIMKYTDSLDEYNEYIKLINYETSIRSENPL
jgi:hypothetical protein